MKQTQLKDFNDNINFEQKLQDINKQREDKQKRELKEALDKQLVMKQQQETMRASHQNDPYKTSMGPEDTQDVMKFKNEMKKLKQQKLNEELAEQTRFKKETEERIKQEDKLFAQERL